MNIHSIQTKAKTPLDKRIARALVDRKILQFRFDAHLRQEVWKRLSKAQRKLLSRISAAGIEALSKRELDKLLKELKAEIAKSYAETTAYIQPELSGFFDVEKNALTKLYNKEVGFDFFNSVPDYAKNATQKAVIVAGMPMGDWVAKQGKDLAFRFEGTVRQGLLDGKQTPEIVSEVKQLFNTSRRNAETLVITAVAKVGDDAHKALRDENLDLIKGEKHLATLDMRTSETCRLRDGLMWDLEQKPIGHSVPYQRPPLHPRCRSILQLVFKSWEELGFKGVEEMPDSTRASMDGQVSENTTYEDWLKSKTAEEQDEVLGKGKADLWRRGAITFADMLDQRGRPLTLEALRELDTSLKQVNASRQKSFEIEKELPKDFTAVIDIGKRLHQKYERLLDEAIESSKPYESVMEIMRREGVELGGRVNVVGLEKRAVSEITEALQRYPKSWVEKSNVTAGLVVKEYKARAFQVKIPNSWDLDKLKASNVRWGRLQPLASSIKKGLVKNGDSFIVSNTNHSEVLRLSRFIHEYGHKLQSEMPELDRYFTDFWLKRTKGKPYAKHMGETIKEGNFPHPYYGRDYGDENNPQPKEMLTMTFEALLGNDPNNTLNDLRTKDPELFSLGLALLTRYK